LFSAFVGSALSLPDCTCFAFDDPDEQSCAADVAFGGAFEECIGDAIAVAPEDPFAGFGKDGAAGDSEAIGFRFAGWRCGAVVLILSLHLGSSF